MGVTNHLLTGMILQVCASQFGHHFQPFGGQIRNNSLKKHLQGEPLVVINGVTWDPYQWPKVMANWGKIHPEISGVMNPPTL